MKIELPTYRGRAPRVSPRALSEGYAQVANSPRLLSGDLESWRERKFSAGLAKSGRINTIYRLASRTGDRTPFWLHWTDAELAAGETNVDVALGPEPGDTDVATYFTGTALGPRYTTKFLATDESQRPLTSPIGAYPYASLPLGINPPTLAPTVTQTLPIAVGNSLSYYESGASTTNWSTVKTGGAYANLYSITDPAFQPDAPVTSLSAPYYFLQWQSGGGALALWNESYDLDNATGLSFSVNLDTSAPSGSNNNSTGNMAVVLLAADTGIGPRIDFYFRPNGALSNDTSASTVTYTDSAAGATAVTIPGVTITGNTPVKLVITGTKDAASATAAVATWKLNIEIRSYETDALLGSLSNVTATVAGNSIGVIGYRGAQSNATSGFFNDVRLTTALAPPAGPVPVFTNYVYTIVNAIGWESAPSPPSAAVTVDNGITNNVTIPAQAATDIAKIRLYRASTSTTEAQYLFVADLTPPLPTTYADSALSSEIGPDVLITTDFDLPPANLRGILALPCGALCGFAGNQICFSEVEYPYAWPVKYRLTVDYNIVAIAAINSIVVALTEAFVRLAAGNLPGDYALETLEYPQGCVSKRSVALVSGYGVLYASPDGLYSITGSGPPNNATEMLFARREWQAINPSSLIASSHDDRYFGFYQTTNVDKSGLILDFKSSGFGMIDIPDHATAVYADPITDILYFVADDTYIEATA